MLCLKQREWETNIAMYSLTRDMTRSGLNLDRQYFLLAERKYFQKTFCEKIGNKSTNGLFRILVNNSTPLRYSKKTRYLGIIWGRISGRIWVITRL